MESLEDFLHYCKGLRRDSLLIIIFTSSLAANPSDISNFSSVTWGGGPRVVVSTAAFHARVRGSVPGVSKETKMFLPHPRVKLSIVGGLRDREVACSASDRQGSNLESYVWRTVSSHSSHHPQEVLLAQLSLYVQKGGLKPDLFLFSSITCVVIYCVFIALTRSHYLSVLSLVKETDSEPITVHSWIRWSAYGRLRAFNADNIGAWLF